MVLLHRCFVGIVKGMCMYVQLIIIIQAWSAIGSDELVNSNGGWGWRGKRSM